MPRTARTKSSTGIYHVIIRGADRQNIFEDKNDYIKYLNYLEYYKAECAFDLYAYCLMSNHIHILLHVNSTPLKKIFQRINTAYACWFNMKYSRTGFLQQGRYHSEPVETQEYLYTVIRYIHHNPFKAGLESFPGESYPWTSLFSYIHQNNNLVSTSHITNLIGGYDSFINYHNKTTDNDQCMDVETIRKRLPDDVAKQIIYDTCNCSNTKEFQDLSLISRDKAIILLNKKGISVRQLNRLTGIPLGLISKIISKNQKQLL